MFEITFYPFARVMWSVDKFHVSISIKIWFSNFTIHIFIIREFSFWIFISCIFFLMIRWWIRCSHYLILELHIDDDHFESFYCKLISSFLYSELIQDQNERLRYRIVICSLEDVMNRSSFLSSKQGTVPRKSYISFELSPIFFECHFTEDFFEVSKKITVMTNVSRVRNYLRDVHRYYETYLLGS